MLFLIQFYFSSILYPIPLIVIIISVTIFSLIPVHQLVECAKTYQNWAYEIKNSLEVPYSNGPIEGTNNKIKALKRVTFGMTKFDNFKARILLLN